MTLPDDRIRVGERVKREPDRRRRDGESYNDLVERLRSERTGADFSEGFGIRSDERAKNLPQRRSERP